MNKRTLKDWSYLVMVSHRAMSHMLPLNYKIGPVSFKQVDIVLCE